MQVVYGVKQFVGKSKLPQRSRSSPKATGVSGGGKKKADLGSLFQGHISNQRSTLYTGGICLP